MPTLEKDIVILAKQDSRCKVCGDKTRKGISRITPRKIRGRKYWIHVDPCSRDFDEKQKKGKAKTRRALITDETEDPDDDFIDGPVMHTDQHGCMRCNPSNPLSGGHGCPECRHLDENDSDDLDEIDVEVEPSWKDIDPNKIANKDEISKLIDIALEDVVIDVGTEEIRKKLTTELRKKLEDVKGTLTKSILHLQKETVDSIVTLKGQLQDWLDKREPRKLEIKLPKLPKQVLSGHRHADFEEAMEYAVVGEPTMLVGPTGSGKSWLSKQIAEALKLKYYFVSCSAGMSEGQVSCRQLPSEPTPAQIKARFNELTKIGFSPSQAATMASTAGSFVEQVSQYVVAYETGGLFLLDEMDNADPNVLVFINASLDGNGMMSLPNRPSKPFAKRHKKFHLIAACNTFGRGADRLYVGRTQIDESTIDRFRFGTINMDYDHLLEEKLCPDDSLRERLWRYRRGVFDNQLERVVSTRFLEKSHIWKNDYKLRTDDQIDEKLFIGWSNDEITLAKNARTGA